MAVDFGNPYRVLNDVWDQIARALRITGSVSVTDSSGTVIDSFGGGAALDLYKTNNIDDGSTTADTIYVGKAKDDGTYCVIKIDETTGALPVYTFATITNNGAVTTYASAWTNRATLTYGYYHEAF